MVDSSVVLGLILPVFAGFCNSSWNLPIKEQPRLWTACVPEWSWEQFWFVYTIGSVISVIIFTYGTISPRDLSAIFSATESKNIFLMILFAIFWGVGTLFFGLAVAIVGMGTGLTLALAIAILLGTIYPLFLENQEGNPSTLLSWILLVVGCILMMVGIYGLGVANAKQKEGRRKAKAGASYELAAGSAPKDAPKNAPNDEEIGSATATSTVAEDTTFTTLPMLTPNQQFLLCLLAGVLSSCMQWVFLVGEETITVSKSLGLPGFAETGAVWFVAFLVSGALNCTIAAVIMARNGTFSRFGNPLSDKEEGRRFFCSFCSGLVWASHVYLYSGSAELIGPVVAFPLVMISTMLCSQFWGVGLKEWTIGEPGWSTNRNAFAGLVVAIIIFAVVGVLEQKK